LAEKVNWEGKTFERWRNSLTFGGDKLIERVANDLRPDFPILKGLSNSNLKYCKRFFEFYDAGAVEEPVPTIEAA